MGNASLDYADMLLSFCIDHPPSWLKVGQSAGVAIYSVQNGMSKLGTEPCSTTHQNSYAATNIIIYSTKAGSRHIPPTHYAYTPPPLGVYSHDCSVYTREKLWGRSPLALGLDDWND